MALQVALANDPNRAVPLLGMVHDGAVAKIYDANGEVAGSAAALKGMQALYQSANRELPPMAAFDLYAAAVGNLVLTDPISVDMSFAEAGATVREMISDGQRIGTPTRQSALDRIARARETMMMDSMSAIDDTEGGDGAVWDQAWRPELSDEFHAAAYDPPIPDTPEVRAAKNAYLDQWLAARGDSPEPVAEETVEVEEAVDAQE